MRYESNQWRLIGLLAMSFGLFAVGTNDAVGGFGRGLARTFLTTLGQPRCPRDIPIPEAVASSRPRQETNIPARPDTTFAVDLVVGDKADLKKAGGDVALLLDNKSVSVLSIRRHVGLNRTIGIIPGLELLNADQDELKSIFDSFQFDQNVLVLEDPQHGLSSEEIVEACNWLILPTDLPGHLTFCCDSQNVTDENGFPRFHSTVISERTLLRWIKPPFCEDGDVRFVCTTRIKDDDGALGVLNVLSFDQEKYEGNEDWQEYWRVFAQSEVATFGEGVLFLPKVLEGEPSRALTTFMAQWVDSKIRK